MRSQFVNLLASAMTVPELKLRTSIELSAPTSSPPSSVAEALNAVPANVSVSTPPPSITSPLSSEAPFTVMIEAPLLLLIDVLPPIVPLLMTIVAVPVATFTSIPTPSVVPAATFAPIVREISPVPSDVARIPSVPPVMTPLLVNTMSLDPLVVKNIPATLPLTVLSVLRSTVILPAFVPPETIIPWVALSPLDTISPETVRLVKPKPKFVTEIPSAAPVTSSTFRTRCPEFTLLTRIPDLPIPVTDPKALIVMFPPPLLSVYIPKLPCALPPEATVISTVSALTSSKVNMPASFAPVAVAEMAPFAVTDIVPPV